MTPEEIDKLMEEAERWVPTFRLGSLEIDLMNRLIQAVRELRDYQDTHEGRITKEDTDDCPYCAQDQRIAEVEQQNAEAEKERDRAILAATLAIKESARLREERDELRAKLDTYIKQYDLLAQQGKQFEAKLERAKEVLEWLNRNVGRIGDHDIINTVNETLAAI